jgi:adenylate cyclase
MTGRAGARAFPDPADLIDWIIRTATANEDGEALLAGFCEALSGHGVPIWRANIATPTIDPNFRALSFNWHRRDGSSVFAQPHGPEGDRIYLRSPVNHLVQLDQRAGRWRIGEGEGCTDFTLLEELRLQGGTDYLLRTVPFVASTALIGAAISFATDQAGGFTQGEIDYLDRFVPALGLAVYRLNLSRTFRDVLGAYLGEMSAGRVIQGMVQRGDSEVIEAAILLADLKGFTTAADREDPLAVVRSLNGSLDALGSAVTEAGGEILKFTGDGFIAIFPLAPPGPAGASECDRALEAARVALARLGALNRGKRPFGMAFAVDMALHFGELVYGNVGTSRRLDFTTIGRAVNEASRMEKLCDELGVNLVVSDRFAQRCTHPLRDLGTFQLRGVSGSMRLWAPEEPGT